MHPRALCLLHVYHWYHYTLTINERILCLFPFSLRTIFDNYPHHTCPHSFPAFLPLHFLPAFLPCIPSIAVWAQAAVLTAQGIYAPSKNCLDELYNYHAASVSVGQQRLEQIDDINQAWSVWGLYNATLASEVDVRGRVGAGLVVNTCCR